MAALSHALHRSVELHPWLGKVLLGCGVVASTWWIAMDVIGSLRYEGYSYVDHTISELSAEGAPTKTFMLTLSAIPYAVLMIGFGMGVWAAAGRTRAGRITGALLAGEAAFGLLGGLLFPMARREVIAAGEDTLRNRLHAPYGVGMPILFLIAIGFGTTLLGRRFRWYSYGTIVVLLVFGALTALQSGRVEANESTPWLGVTERINAYAAMLWLTVLAIGLLRVQQGAIVTTQLGEPTVTTPAAA